MAQTSTGSLDSDSFERGWKQYDKTSSFWSTMKFYSLGTIILGVVQVPILLLNDYVARNLPQNLVLPAMIIDGALLLTAALLFGTTSWIIKHRQLRYPTHSLMLHAMKEMGLQHPAKILAANPRYLEAYDEVGRTFLRIEANETDKNKLHENFSAHSHRVASLVLRDERSLALTPHLINLIKADHMRSYESLAGELDGHTPATAGQSA